MPASTRLRNVINVVHLFYAVQYKIRRLLASYYTRLAFIARVYSFFRSPVCTNNSPLCSASRTCFVVSGIVNSQATFNAFSKFPRNKQR